MDDVGGRQFEANPQAVVPGNVMPNMGISPKDSAAIAAYLYTLD